MIFLFSLDLKNINLECEVTIPHFDIWGKRPNNLKLTKCFTKSGRWLMEDLHKNPAEKTFTKHHDAEANDWICTYFDNDTETQSKFHTTLPAPSLYTHSEPAFRGCIEIKNKHGNTTSYQGEYPYSMTKRNGVVVCSLDALTTLTAQNFLLFRNISTEAVSRQSEGYFFCLKTQTTLKKINLFSNTTNIINIERKYLESEIVFISANLLGIPIFLSQDHNGNLSMEHTHPPHANMISKDIINLLGKTKNAFLSKSTG